LPEETSLNNGDIMLMESINLWSVILIVKYYSGYKYFDVLLDFKWDGNNQYFAIVALVNDLSQ
jgi:hypothetical protein